MISREHVFILFAFAVVAAIVIFHRRTAVSHDAGAATNTEVTASEVCGGTGGYAYAAANVAYLYPPCLAAVLPVAAR
jgi:hypothetical protein